MSTVATQKVSITEHLKKVTLNRNQISAFSFISMCTRSQATSNHCESGKRQKNTTSSKEAAILRSLVGKKYSCASLQVSVMNQQVLASKCHCPGLGKVSEFLQQAAQRCEVSELMEAALQLRLFLRHSQCCWCCDRACRQPQRDCHRLANYLS